LIILTPSFMFTAAAVPSRRRAWLFNQCQPWYTYTVISL